MVFRGIETIDNDSPEYVCDSKLVFGGIEQELSPVTYRADLTPSLKSIQPRYGTVKGGTLVAFTGTNFPADPS